MLTGAVLSSLAYAPLDNRTISQQQRKLIEQAVGWLKTSACFANTHRPEAGSPKPAAAGRHVSFSAGC